MYRLFRAAEALNMPVPAAARLPIYWIELGWLMYIVQMMIDAKLKAPRDPFE